MTATTIKKSRVVSAINIECDRLNRLRPEGKKITTAVSDPRWMRFFTQLDEAREAAIAAGKQPPAMFQCQIRLPDADGNIAVETLRYDELAPASFDIVMSNFNALQPPKPKPGRVKKATTEGGDPPAGDEGGEPVDPAGDAAAETAAADEAAAAAEGDDEPAGDTVNEETADEEQARLDEETAKEAEAAAAKAKADEEAAVKAKKAADAKAKAGTVPPATAAAAKATDPKAKAKADAEVKKVADAKAAEKPAESDDAEFFGS